MHFNLIDSSYQTYHLSAPFSASAYGAYMFSSTSAGCVPCRSTDYRTSSTSTAFVA